MNNYFELIWTDIKKLWGALELPQKIMFALVFIAMVGALTFFIAKTTEPNWSVLYSDLQQQDVMAITESLKKNGYNVYGVDNSENMLVEAVRLSNQEQIFVNFIRQDIKSI